MIDRNYIQRIRIASKSLLLMRMRMWMWEMKEMLDIDKRRCLS